MKKVIGAFTVIVLLLIAVFACADSLTDYDRQRDKSIFDQIDSKKPKTEYQIRYRQKANLSGDSGGLCNVSAITTLLNRRLVADYKTGSFTVTNVLTSLGCKNIYTDGKIYCGTEFQTSGTKWCQYYYFTPNAHQTTIWCISGQKYTNGSNTYSVSQIGAATIKKKTAEAGGFYEYIVQLLHDHPEGIAIRNKKANHVAVIYRYSYTNGKYTLYVKDPVYNYSGVLENSYIYDKSGKNLYDNIDFIVYISGNSKMASTVGVPESITRSYYKTNKATRLYSAPDESCAKLSVEKDIGVIATGKMTVGSKTWYMTADNYFVKAEDISFVENAPEIGGYTLEDATIRFMAKIRFNDGLYLEDEPYADAKNMLYVRAGEILPIKGLYKNKYQNYWVGVDVGGRLFYTCANNIVFVSDDSTNDVTINGNNYAPNGIVTDGSLFPNGTRNKGAGFELRGTISSQYTIKSAQGFVYSGNLQDRKVEAQTKLEPINKKSFDLNSSNINIAKNGGIAFGKLSEGNKAFRLLVVYDKPVWKNITNEKERPINFVECAKNFYSTFSVGTNNDSNPLGDIAMEVKVTSCTIDTPSITVNISESYALNVTILPANAANKEIVWSTSNASVAMVIDGIVYAVGEGTAKITATTKDGGKTATCIVTVPAGKEMSLAEKIRIAIVSEEYVPELDLNKDGRVNAQDYILAKKDTPQSGIEKYVYRCYDIILGREPDPNGLNTWVNELNSGRKAAAEIIDNFVRSQEFLGKKHNNPDAVEILYKAMLGRGSDPAGKADWVGKLDAGHPFAVVINGFCGSKEFKEICDGYGIAPGSVSMEQGSESDQQIRAFVTRCYKIILGRDPDGGGMSTWFDELKSLRRTAAEIIEQFVYSNEFQNRKYPHPEAVEILYKAMLGRGSDPAGKADWVGRLNKGQPLTAIINGFCGSTEFTTICKTYGIKPGSVKVENVSRAAEEPAEAVVRKSETKANLVEITNPSDTVNEQLGSAVQALYINEEKAKEFVGRCYRFILGREAGEEELGGWIKQMINGSKTADQIARGFLFSGEFKDKNVSNEELVKILYRVYMNREADAEGLATWTQKLDEGTGLNDLLNVFAKTNEFKAVLKNMAE